MARNITKRPANIKKLGLGGLCLEVPKRWRRDEGIQVAVSMLRSVELWYQQYNHWSLSLTLYPSRLAPQAGANWMDEWKIINVTAGLSFRRQQPFVRFEHLCRQCLMPFLLPCL